MQHAQNRIQTELHGLKRSFQLSDRDSLRRLIGCLSMLVFARLQATQRHGSHDAGGLCYRLL